VEAEAALEVARCPYLVGMGGDQCGVEVQRDPLRRRPLRPGSLARLPTRPAQDVHSLRCDRVDDTPGGRRRRHLAEQLGLLAQHIQVGQAAAPVRDGHDQIPHHLVRVVGRPPASSGRHLRRQRCRQPSLSASSLRAALPAWLAIPPPSAVTMSMLRRLVGFTFNVLTFDGS
jgi:hypothetical protein